jgi:hypothetical protein
MNDFKNHWKQLIVIIVFLASIMGYALNADVKTHPAFDKFANTIVAKRGSVTTGFQKQKLNLEKTKEYIGELKDYYSYKVLLKNGLNTNKCLNQINSNSPKRSILVDCHKVSKNLFIKFKNKEFI